MPHKMSKGISLSVPVSAEETSFTRLCRTGFEC